MIATYEGSRAWTGASVLVTGASGFIGRNLVARLQGAGVARVYTVGRGPAGLPDTIYRPMDLTDSGQVASSLSSLDIDYVFHCAGVIDQGVSSGIYREQFAAHVSATLHLTEALAGRIRRFVHVGSNAEYGDALCPQAAEGPVRPNSAYGVSKLAASALVVAKARSEGFPAVVVRPFLVYGEGQAARSFLSAAHQAARAGKEFPTTMGEQTRDFVPVAQVVEDLFAAAAEDMTIGRIVNSCTGHPRSIRSVLKMLTELHPGFRPIFGAVPYRQTELMESHGVPFRPVLATTAEHALRSFLS